MKDSGLAAATAVISAFIQFHVVTDAEKNITVDNLDVKVSIDSLAVDMLKADHKWLFKMALSFFAGSVQAAVQVCCYINQATTFVSLPIIRNELFLAGGSHCTNREWCINSQ